MGPVFDGMLEVEDLVEVVDEVVALLCEGMVGLGETVFEEVELGVGAGLVVFLLVDGDAGGTEGHETGARRVGRRESYGFLQKFLICWSGW